MESFELMAKNSCKGVRKDLKKYLLRRKYRLLMTILTKFILGEQSSYDGLSKPRLCCIREILDGVKCDWTGLFLNRLKEEKLVGEEWTANSVVSLFNRITVIMEDLGVVVDWELGVRKYTKQNGLITKNERVGGVPDTDDESAGAREQRRQLEEAIVRRPAVVAPAQSEAAPAAGEGSHS